MFVCTLFEAVEASDMVFVDGLYISWIGEDAEKMRLEYDAKNHFLFDNEEIEINEDGVSVVGDNIFKFVKATPLTLDDI